MTRWYALLATLAASSSAWSQQGAIPPVRPIGRQVAASSDSIGAIAGIRQLSDGRVIVNDTKKHQLLILDSTLSHPVVIADTTESTKKAYGAVEGGIIPYRADTTLFVDPRATSILVIDPHGATARVIAPPRPADVVALAHGFGGDPGFDTQGRLVYDPHPMTLTNRGGIARGIRPMPPLPVGSTMPVWAQRDSDRVIRTSLNSQSFDTAGFFAVPYGGAGTRDTAANGTITITSMRTPDQAYDAWAVVADGSVALLRGRDYRIDWISADGMRSTTTIAHEWHRRTDDEKAAVVDSLRREGDSLMRQSAAAFARSDSLSEMRRVPWTPSLGVLSESEVQYGNDQDAAAVQSRVQG